MNVTVSYYLPSDQEAAMAREKLEKDLHSTKAQLIENHTADGPGLVSDGTATSLEHSSYVNSEHDVS